MNQPTPASGNGLSAEEEREVRKILQAPGRRLGAFERDGRLAETRSVFGPIRGFELLLKEARGLGRTVTAEVKPKKSAVEPD